MRLPIGLYGVFLGAPLALPLLLAVLSTEVLFYSRQIAKGSCRVVMHAGGLRAHIDPLPDFFGCSLPQLPRQVVASPMELQVLITLEPFVADLAHETVGCEERCRRQSDHLRFGIWHSGEVSLFLRRWLWKSHGFVSRGR